MKHIWGSKCNKRKNQWLKNSFSFTGPVWMLTLVGLAWEVRAWRSLLPDPALHIICSEIIIARALLIYAEPRLPNRFWSDRRTPLPTDTWIRGYSEPSVRIECGGGIKQISRKRLGHWLSEAENLAPLVNSYIWKTWSGLTAVSRLWMSQHRPIVLRASVLTVGQ